MKNVPLKQKIFFSILILILIFVNVKYLTSGVTIEDPFKIDKGVECGTIITNFSELTNVKRGTNTDYYLKIKYDDRTIIERVSAKIYLDSAVGDKICFQKNETIGFLMFMFIVTEIFIIFLLSLYLCIRLFYWIFDFRWE